MARETTQLARTPLLLLDYAQRHGLDRRELVAGAGLTEAQLADPDTRIPTAAMRRHSWSGDRHARRPIPGPDEP